MKSYKIILIVLSMIFSEAYFRMALAQADCESSVVITDPVLDGSTEMRKSGDNIFASNTIYSGGSATYQASFQVVLSDGFSAREGSYFHADNTFCSIPFNTSRSVNAEDETIEEVNMLMPDGDINSSPNDASGFASVNVYPNAAKDIINFDIILPEVLDAKLVIYNTMGKQMMIITEGKMSAGRHQVSADVSGLGTGTYIYRLETSTSTPLAGRIVVL